MVAGQGTVALELMQQAGPLDTLLVPVGGLTFGTVLAATGDASVAGGDGVEGAPWPAGASGVYAARGGVGVQMATEQGPPSDKARHAARWLMEDIEQEVTADGNSYYREDKCEEVRHKLYVRLLFEEMKRDPLRRSLRLLDREAWPLDLTHPMIRPSMYIVVERSTERDWALQLPTGQFGIELVDGSAHRVGIGGIRFVTKIPPVEIADRMAWLQELDDGKYRQVPFKRRDPRERVKAAIRYYESRPSNKIGRKRLPVLRFNLNELETDASHLTSDRRSWTDG